MCREIATAGNGSYIYVDNSSSAQRKLMEQLDRLSKTKMESQIYSEYDEQYQGFVLIGLLLLLIDVLLLERESKSTWLGNLFRRQRSFSVFLMLFFSLAAMSQTDRDYIRRGNRFMRDSVYDKAQVEYQKAIEQDNTNPISHYNLGNALLYQNKAEDAMKEYETAARLEKDKMRLAQIYHNMGVILQAAKQFDKAVACYQNSLRNDPTCNETRYNYALSLFQLKKNQQNQDNQEQQQDDKGQDEKEEKQQQQQQQEQEKKDEQQPQPQQDQMSRENAEQMLNAAMQDEKATQEKIQKAQQQRQQKQLQKQW